MKRFLPTGIIALTCLLATNMATAQDVGRSDSLKVSFYYEVARHDIDANFVRHQRMVAEMADTVRVDSVRILGYVSPEGSFEFNRQLAQDRAYELARLVALQWPAARILEVRGMGVDYGIEQVRSKWPLMRRADAYIWYHPIDRQRPAAVPAVGVCNCADCAERGYCDGCPGCNGGHRDCGCEEGTGKRDTVILYYTPEPKKEPDPADQTPAWALKTNLLLLGVAAPNLQAEFLLGGGNRWSLEGEVICPWWTFDHNAYAEQVLNFGLEARLWLGRRQYHPCLDGWHIGLAAAFGYYDLEWQSEGYQGEHVNGYVNFGYQHRWGRDKRWGIDAGIGIGAIVTPKHRHYLGSTIFPENHTEQYDDHLMYQNHGNFIWPGASHINVTLMYFFDFKDKEGGR